MISPRGKNGNGKIMSWNWLMDVTRKIETGRPDIWGQNNGSLYFLMHKIVYQEYASMIN